MRWFALTVSYNGTDFGGWQIQNNAPSIQARLIQAIEQATGESVKIRGSGRTDAGVHAEAQIVSLALERWRAPTDRLVPAINRFLPPTIVVRGIENTVPGFDPVRNATSKRYRYEIWSSRLGDPMRYPFHWWIPRKLDIDRMRDAAQYLIGLHDFKAFETLGSPRRTSVRHVYALDIDSYDRWEGKVIGIEIEANGFLYNMVRNIVGALVAIGSGRFDPKWMETTRDSLVRKSDSQTAPAQGLCLMRVHYPDHLFPDRLPTHSGEGQSDLA